MITGTSNIDEIPEVFCPICGGNYKADEPEKHDCGETVQSPIDEIECDICGHISKDPEGRHYCCED